MVATTILDVEKPLPTSNQMTNLHQNWYESIAQTADSTFNAKE